MKRHFTVTGFVSRGDATALHWHRLGMWLPPGGHIEPDEDPIEAVLREVREETGLTVEVIPTVERFDYREPVALPPPVTIGVYDIPRDGGLDEAHQHIDLVYVTRPLDDADLRPERGEIWRWVDSASLRDGVAIAPDGGAPVAVADDVRELGLAAIEAARAAVAAGA
jgi:8-oxo-dGTP pyrophosphatase MutT (NUDIX family)